jgi:putative Ca2+/H+ antiporter (TMEM165/GDT1 family)
VEWIAAALVAFALIVPVELPDKTFVATLVLATRYPPLPVWLGVTVAFGLQCLVAVTAGRLLGLLPRMPVQLAAAGLFAVGAVILFRGARKADAEEAEHEQHYSARIKNSVTGWRAAGTSFLVLFAAEWGDLSQLLTASLVASGRNPVPVFVGSWIGLTVVAGAGVLLGRVLLRHVRLSLVRYVGAAVCAVLAVITLVSSLSSAWS